MKNVLIIFSVAAILSSCSNQQASQTSEASAISTDSGGMAFTADTAGSVLEWEATKLVGGHKGKIQINAGSLNIKEGNIVSGGFSIDMNTITDSDITDSKYNTDLVNHLKSPDFFNAAAFPEGRFEITASEPLVNDASGFTHRISGNLRIKDSTRNISFPVKVVVENDQVTAEGEAVINRLQWGIVYNSVSVSPAALLKKIGDNAIKDEVKIRINLRAKKS